MSYITPEQLTFGKLSKLQSQLQHIETSIPSSAELVKIAEEYDSNKDKPNAVFSLLVHIASLKLAEARLAVLIHDFDLLKPDVTAILDQAGDNAKNLGGSVAFFLLATEQERLKTQISDQIRQIKSLVCVIDVNAATRRRLDRALNASDLLEAARSLNLTY